MAHLQKYQAGQEGWPRQSAPPSAQIPASHPPVGPDKLPKKAELAYSTRGID